MFAAPSELMQVATANRATPESAAAQNEAANRFADQAQPLYAAVERYRKFQSGLHDRLTKDRESARSM